MADRCAPSTNRQRTALQSVVFAQVHTLRAVKYMQVHPLHTTIPCDNDGLNPDSIHGSPQNTYFFMPDRASWAILTQDASDPPPLLRPEQHCLPQKRDWRLRYCHSGKPPDSLIGYRLFLPSAQIATSMSRTAFLAGWSGAAPT